MLLEAVEELIIDIRNKLHLGLFRQLLVLRLHDQLFFICLSVIIWEELGIFILTLLLVTNKGQRDIEGACHENHCAQINI
jgi:hypothetical protein